MKLSYAISLQETGFNHTAKDRWVGKIKLLAYLGYDGVEISIRDSKKININEIENILNRHKLKISAIGTGQIFTDEDLSLSSLKKNLRDKAVNRIKKHIDLARMFNTQVIIGLARGKRAHRSEAEYPYKKNLRNSFKQICDYANINKVIITVEPINRYETSFLNCADEVIDFIKGFKCSFLRMLLDTFHMNIEEKNFIEPIIKSKKYLSHIHFAENNRMCPGMGHIDFKQIVETLRGIGYKGYLSAEISSFPDFTTSAKNYMANINRIL